MGKAVGLIDHPAIHLAGPLAGLACAGAFLIGLDGPALGGAFERVNWWWLVPMLLLGCVNLWLRAARWGVLLAPASPFPTTKLLGIGLASALAGLGLPARGGDAVKILLAARLPGINMADVAAAELLERLVDGAIFGAFIAGAAILGGVPGWPLTLGVGALAIYLPLLAAVPLAGWYLGAGGAGAGGRGVARVRFAGCGSADGGSGAQAPTPNPQPSVWHPRRLIGLVAEAAQRRGPSLLAYAARLSLLAWATEALSYYCLLVAFGWLAPPTLPFAAVGVANFAFAIPGAPAGVGTFHVPVSSLLVDGFGAEPGLAAAFALVLHITILAPVPLLWMVLTARARWLAVPAVVAPVRAR